MQTANRIRFLTDNFSYLQGLKTIPIGLAVIAIGWFENVSGGMGGDLGLPLLILAAGLAGYEAIDRTYRARFGRVRRSLRQRLPEIILGVLAIVGSYLAFWLDPQVDQIGSPLGVVTAILLGAEYLRTSRKTHETYHVYLAICAAAIFLVSLLPAFGAQQWWLAVHFQSQTLAILTFMGILIVIMGIASHLTLIRLLRESEVVFEPGI